MKYYLKEADADLIELPDFHVAAGAVDASKGRRSSDTFLLRTNRKLKTADGLVILDETGMIYDCDARNVSASGSQPVLQIAGVVTKVLMAPDRCAALKTIEAVQKGGGK